MNADSTFGTVSVTKAAVGGLSSSVKMKLLSSKAHTGRSVTGRSC